MTYSIEKLGERFDESDFSKYHPVTLDAWNMTKDDIKSFIITEIRTLLDELVRKEESKKKVLIIHADDKTNPLNITLESDTMGAWNAAKSDTIRRLEEIKQKLQ